jgi:pimeloyl-ACP methyl ester carboxylesterase
MLELPITLKNGGQKITAVMHKPDKSTRRAVILVHGFTGNKNGPDNIFVKLARKLAEQGFAVLRFDFRGSGESDGRFEDMTITGEVGDLRKAIEFVANGYGAVGVVGESLGGAVAAMAYDVEVSCMVLWYPVVYPRETPSFEALEERRDELMLKGSVAVKEKDGVAYRVGKDFYVDRAKLDVASHVRRIRCPLLVVTGNSDSSVPHYHSERAIALATATKEKKLEIIDGADHCFRGARAGEWQQHAIDLTVGWFNQWLK